MDFHKHALILAMIEGLRRHGKRTGKTHIIKGLMLAAATRAIDLPFEFFLYKHGPYSTEVIENLEQMQSYGAITVEPAFDGYGVVVEPAEKADFLKQRAPLPASETTAIEEVCRFVGSKNVVQLERLATAAWIRTQFDIQESDAVAQKLNSLKPHVSLAEALEADREVSDFLRGRSASV